MKKLSVLLVAAIMVLALTMPAAAFENEFGGYFRTRFYTQSGFSGSDQGTTSTVLNVLNSPVQKTTNMDLNAVDTRTRLFYTAKFSENLKFVNKFEFNAVWGKNKTYGQVGADNIDTTTLNSDGTLDNPTNTFRVKNSYVDFKLAEQRFTVGVQGFELARGYIFNDDAAGIKAMFKVNDSIYLPLIYLKVYEGGTGRIGGIGGKSASDFDVSGYVFYPTVYLNKENTLKPHVSYITSENASQALGKDKSLAPGLAGTGATKLDLWSVGLEYDGRVNIFDFGATGIYQFGETTVPMASWNGYHDKLTQQAYVFDIFGGVNLGPANVHVKGIYSSGSGKDDYKNGDNKAFLNPGTKELNGASYYWAEIMGDGIVDNVSPAGSPGDKISNVYIANLGGSYKLLADLKFSADLWYAKRAEDVVIKSLLATPQYSSDLGTELDLVATYTVVDNLKLDLIGAYLWAGDCITKAVDPKGNANPIELAAQFSLAF